MTPARERTVVQCFRAGFQVSEWRACRVAGVPRTTMRYRSRARDQSPLRQRIKGLATVRVRYGSRRIHVLLRREGGKVNAKRVYRLYVKRPLPAPQAIQETGERAAYLARGGEFSRDLDDAE